METQTSSPSNIQKWISSSVSLKILIIGILALILLLPNSMIKSIIAERENLNREAIGEVSAKWANAQQINGPILTIPYINEYTDGEYSRRETVYWHSLPGELTIKGDVAPEKLRRGIYEVVVFESDLQVSGDFQIRELTASENLVEIQYDQAFLTIGVSDLRGIKESVQVNWQGETLEVEPGSRISQIVPAGFTVELPDLSDFKDSEINFDFSLNLQGSESLSFVPLGSTSKVSLNSNWPSPSFNGNFLPDNRDVRDDGFSASWKILQLNRNFPQSWSGPAYGDRLSSSAFGVDLINPIDDYQKSMRSSKYALMTIALTFLVFFLVEILNKRKIHPFQYTLVGLALCLFYILLVSISEHTSFAVAYTISALSIIAIITLYAGKVFHSGRITLFLSFVLIAIYCFLYITIQLVDYALLMGSIGLTFILAITMYFTRNIDWYKLKILPGSSEIKLTQGG